MENSKSQNEESKIQNSGSKNKSSEKKKKSQIPEHIQNLWDDHQQKLSKIHFTNPDNVDHIMPQFCANYLKRIHLAAVFSVPVDEFHRSHYEERLRTWADHLIHHFGYSIDMHHYEAWLKDVYPPSMDHSEVSCYANIHARLFLNEIHEVANRWDLGQQFLNDLFFWVWDKLDKRTIREWDHDEENRNGAPYQGAYCHEENTTMKKENLRKGETELYLLQETPLNLLSSNYAIKMANKT
jgi:hypothetical protein